jgi:hypothetical protein
MDLSKATWVEPSIIKKEEEPVDSKTMERLWYLWPSRYFHLYMFHEKPTSRTCWLPEGYMQ